ncbi:hypothetical protein Goe19_00930 [Bacillus phage vB_BsuM-Goe19]|nr:hypothetical protein Goe19_00930 [Bacillus phage vB_BsuM-Goe19]
MAITTIGAHVSRALDFFGKQDIYFAIGRTSPWEDDNNPPSPNSDMTSLDELIGFKKLDSIQLVVPDDSGTISYRESNWKPVAKEEAYTKKAKWVYIETTIKYDELPLGFYRQIGVYTGLVIKKDVDLGKTALLPDDVENAGVLEVVDNRKPSNRLEDQKEKLTMIIEF